MLDEPMFMPFILNFRVRNCELLSVVGFGKSQGFHNELIRPEVEEYPANCNSTESVAGVCVRVLVRWRREGMRLFIGQPKTSSQHSYENKHCEVFK
jgi:hypothetical protein